MENKAHALAAGIFVLVVSAMVIAMAVWLTRDTGEHRVYEISSAEAVNGLQSQAAVRYRGVSVGKVMEIGFDPKTSGNVLVRIVLDESAPVTSQTFATLGFQGVTGLAFVQLDDTGADGKPLATSEAQPARIPMRASLLSKLSDQGLAILTRLEKSSESINEMLAPDKQAQLMATVKVFGSAAQSVQAMADRVQKLSANLDTVLNAQLGPKRVDIPRFVEDATATMKTLQVTAAGIDQTVAEFRTTASAYTEVAQRLNAKGGPVEQLTEGAAALTQGAQALAQAGAAFNSNTLPRLNRTSDETTRAARQVSRTANAVSENPQSLIFGNGPITPGPGEPGFVIPRGRP